MPSPNRQPTDTRPGQRRRVTPQQRAVLEALERSDKFRSAQQLHAELLAGTAVRAGLTSVYRILHQLTHEQLVETSAPRTANCSTACATPRFTTTTFCAGSAAAPNNSPSTPWNSTPNTSHNITGTPTSITTSTCTAHARIALSANTINRKHNARSPIPRRSPDSAPRTCRLGPTQSSRRSSSGAAAHRSSGYRIPRQRIRGVLNLAPICLGFCCKSTSFDSLQERVSRPLAPAALSPDVGNRATALQPGRQPAAGRPPPRLRGSARHFRYRAASTPGRITNPGSTCATRSFPAHASALRTWNSTA